MGSRRWPFFAALTVLIAVILAAVIVQIVRSGSHSEAATATQSEAATAPQPEAATAPASTPAPAASNPTPALPPPTPAGNAVWMLCDGPDQDVEMTIFPDSDDHYDFTPFWNAHARDCRAHGVDNPEIVAAIGPVEKAALKAGHQDDGNIASLFGICATIGDPYRADAPLNSLESAQELTGALVLCPNHPEAAVWRAAIERGLADAKLRSEGRLFGDGTYVVGRDIKPGTYAAADVHNCYWERLTSAGRVIDNDLVLDAAQVRVTVRKSDYRFHVRDCGQWRPVD